MTAEGLAARMATIAALAEPVRRALYLYVVAQAEPVSRVQAARGVGVAEHVAKFHLDRLVEDRLLDVDYRRPPGRSGPGAGRPAKVYRRSAHTIDISLPERRYEFLGQLLAQGVSDAVRDGVAIDEALEGAAAVAGRALGEDARGALGSRPTRADLLAAGTKVLADHGYEPRTEAEGICLTNCPFHALAQSHTELVCGMNLALLRGLLDGLRLDAVAPVLDPAPTRCCVRLVKHDA